MILYSFFKRIFDLLLAIFLFIILSPLFIFVYLFILLVDKHNPIFIQQRTGYNKKLFNIYKFRTMKLNKITNVGSVLRRLRIDELPQLFNIIKNDMSFVGPRPLFEEYLSLYSLDQEKRFTVPQGLTCFSQIKGGNKLSWKRKLNFDVIYVKKNHFLWT